MSWNNSYEQKKFKKKQEKLVAQYRAAGMNEAQIKAMYDFDLGVFNSERTFRSHNQSLQEYALEDSTREESDNALLNRNLDALCVTIDNPEHHSRYWWIEEISDPKLVTNLKQLSEDDLFLLFQYVFEQATQSYLASYYGISQKNICKKINRIKNFLSRGV